MRVKPAANEVLVPLVEVSVKVRASASAGVGLDAADAPARELAVTNTPSTAPPVSVTDSSGLVEPEIAKLVNVPTDVIADWAAPVTVAAVPETLPVTLPVRGPEKAVAVRVPVVAS